MARTRQTARRPKADDADEDEKKNSTATGNTSPSPEEEPPKKKSKSTKASSSSSSASLPFALPDPTSNLDVDACGLNTSNAVADVMVDILHTAIAHYASQHGLSHPRPPSGWGRSGPPAGPDNPTSSQQLSFFNTTPDTELILLPLTRITVSLVPTPPKDAPPFTLATLASEYSTPFHRGSGYYQLTRPEKVSDTKKIIAAYHDEPGDGVYMTGKAVRFGPGIPPAGSKGKAVMVDPAELKKGWTVWVQSTSANRQLEPGTRAIYDVHPEKKWPIG